MEHLARLHFLIDLNGDIQLQNLHYVVDVDIKGFFDNINHAKLIRQIWAMGIQDLKVIAIIRAMLKAEILFNDIVISPETGTPQGGILSPLLSNIVLNELDWWIASQWEFMPTRVNREYCKTDKDGNEIVDRSQKWTMLREKSRLKEIYIVRYADDFKIFCRDYSTAKKIYSAVIDWLKERLHLEVSVGGLVGGYEKTVVFFLADRCIPTADLVLIVSVNARINKACVLISLELINNLGSGVTNLIDQYMRNGI